MAGSRSRVRRPGQARAPAAEPAEFIRAADSQGKASTKVSRRAPKVTYVAIYFPSRQGVIGFEPTHPATKAAVTPAGPAAFSSAPHFWRLGREGSRPAGSSQGVPGAANPFELAALVWQRERRFQQTATLWRPLMAHPTCALARPPNAPSLERTALDQRRSLGLQERTPPPGPVLVMNVPAHAISRAPN